MTAEDFLKQHLRRSELPETISVETAIEVIIAARLAAVDQTSDFDEVRIQNLRSALLAIEESTVDTVALLTAKRALMNDDAEVGGE
ncbi:MULTISPECIES: hypothetical protein [Pseudomonas]|uniref:Uncharacterized protein n=1 Tax=Pseudomonas fluorescens TaxID=294 RepID=A0A166QTH2_PSEFL|nr:MULTISPECIES: hypothetical protein [Pseudomonas]KZN20833.1 hypothetical protein A1D17_04635 [Pseudomonas fluorescens]